MTALFNAQELAFHLDGQPLHRYQNDLLAVSTIAADDYALLAVMPTTSGWEIYSKSESRGQAQGHHMH